MIRDLRKLTNGMWIADYRGDEGVRVREEPISPTITANSGGGITHMVLLIEVTDGDGRMIKEEVITLDTSQDIAVLTEEGKRLRVRQLTPRECFRLQGWTDEYFDRAEFVNSDNQLFRQAGNGVTVNVIEEIAKRF